MSAHAITFHRPTSRAASDAAAALFDLPFPRLIDRARAAHLAHHADDTIQLSTLLSIKTGGCPEDCGYCSQSARHDAAVPASKLMDVAAVLAAASAAKAQGASRFCMGAAWRSPKDADLPTVAEMVRGVRALGLETCVTLGMLRAGQAQALREAGLDYYNHNLDTSPDYYGTVVGTRTYADRLDTLGRARDAGIKLCCGGIVGMGESRADRAALLAELAALSPQPESVPINHLVPIPGTPLAGAPSVDGIEFVRTIAVARILMPRAMIRLSAGREAMDDSLQTLCLLAGANSIFYGDRLLTTGNPQAQADRAWLARLGMRIAGSA